MAEIESTKSAAAPGEGTERRLARRLEMLRKRRSYLEKLGSRTEELKGLVAARRSRLKQVSQEHEQAIQEIAPFEDQRRQVMKMFSDVPSVDLSSVLSLPNIFVSSHPDIGILYFGVVALLDVSMAEEDLEIRHVPKDRLVQFVACTFGRSRGERFSSLITTDTVSSVIEDYEAEELVRGRFEVGEEGELLFGSGKHNMLAPALARPPLADEQLSNQREMRGSLAVVHGGRCAVALKALRALQAGAEGVVVLLDLDPSRPLLPPAPGRLEAAEQVDVPVLCMRKEDEGRLLAAHRVKVCMLKSGFEASLEEEKEEDQSQELISPRKTRRRENILEEDEVEEERGKGVEELTEKWSKWKEFKPAPKKN